MRLDARKAAQVIAVLAWPLASTCGGDTPPITVVSRDSAGVRIVENVAPAWSEGEEWRVSEEPLLHIGTIDGSPEYLFGRAHSPVRLSDGRIVVADMQTNLMSFYSPEGEFLMSVGGTGDGPGEFRQLYRMRKIAGDSLMALNPASLTSIFSPQGEFVRRFSLDPVPTRGNLWWIGQADGDALVVMSLLREGSRYVAASLDAEEGVARIVRPERHEFYRDTLLHFLFTMQGELIDSVVKLPGQFMAENRTFAPNAAYTVFRDEFIHSPGDVAEIRRFRTDAIAGTMQLRQIVRRPPLRDLTVTEAMKAAYRDRELAEAREMAAQFPQMDLARVERRIAEMTFPERIPDHDNRIYADPLGNLWLQDYRIVDEGPFRWSVFAADGTWLGLVETPASLTVNEFGEDYVLGIWTDEFDVEYVRMYAIDKPAG